MVEAEIKRVLECLDRLFEENESGETLLGRIEVILQEAIGKDEKVIREIVQNLPPSLSEQLRFKILDGCRDTFTDRPSRHFPRPARDGPHHPIDLC